MTVRHTGTAVISIVLVGLGVAAIVRTVQAGVGGGIGLVFGGLLIAAGALRLFLTIRTGR